MIDEQSQRLNEIIDILLDDNSSRIATVKSLISSLIIIEPVLYDLTKKLNSEYKELSANYTGHLLSGNDSLCERYKCRDALNDYKYSAEFYTVCVMDIKWLMDELYALRIVELCRTGL